MSETEKSEPENVADLDKKYVEDGPSTEFANLLEQEKVEPEQKKVTVGQRVSGTVQKVDDTSAFIDFGGRSEAVIDLQELRDGSGEVSIKEDRKSVV